MNKVKTKKLKNHMFKSKCPIFNYSTNIMKKIEIEFIITNDELGTTVSLIRDNEQISISMEHIFKKLGIEVEIEDSTKHKFEA